MQQSNGAQGWVFAGTASHGSGAVAIAGLMIETGVAGRMELELVRDTGPTRR